MKIKGRILSCDLDENTLTIQLGQGFFETHQIQPGDVVVETKSIEAFKMTPTKWRLFDETVKKHSKFPAYFTLIFVILLIIYSVYRGYYCDSPYDNDEIKCERKEK